MSQSCSFYILRSKSGVHHEICLVLDVILGEIGFLQRDPPGSEALIAVALPRLQAAGLLVIGTGHEHPEVLIRGQQRVL